MVLLGSGVKNNGAIFSLGSYLERFNKDDHRAVLTIPFRVDDEFLPPVPTSVHDNEGGFDTRGA
ncbi:conserved hypothetical protein [Ricinus communis]|uniref:Uncharacterized protein n=1 Tax=Ricinus communis TaxID=3988 RepID=B9REH7_RICCO|nr:conserved hypothetical protein [Ricinus communis]